MFAERGNIEKVSAEKHELIAQGAEAKVYTGSFYGKKCIAKVRFAKKYRHHTLDTKLRETRTIREARALLKAARYGIHVPLLLGVDKDSCTLWMEKIDGCTVKELLDKEDSKRKASIVHNKCQNSSHFVQNNCNVEECESCIDDYNKRSDNNDNYKCCDMNTKDSKRLSELTIQLLTEIGQVVGQMHNHNIIHGDLTTSNFMYCMSAEESAGNSVQTYTTDNMTIRNNKEAKCNLEISVINNSFSELRTRNKLVVLDFGLINEKNSVEERAVDLFVLEKAIMATHPFIVDNFNKAESSDNINANGDLQNISHAKSNKNHNNCNADIHTNKCQGFTNGVDYIYRGYISSVTDTKRCEATLARLATVRARGRKRSMIG